MRPRAVRAAVSGTARLTLALLTGTVLISCASSPPSVPGMTGGSAGVAAVLSPEVEAMLARTRAREQELMGQPLTADSAAEIALLHHPAIDRGLAVLGLLQADRLLLAHTVNPAFNNGRPSSTVEWRVQSRLSVNLMTWLSEPALAPTLTTEERTARVQAADEVGAHLFEAQRAWVGAVAARQSVRYFEDVVAAAEISRDLMQGMRNVGNASELDALRGQHFYAEAVALLTQAQAEAAIERERLAQALGIWGEDAERVQLPDRLPDLPATAIGPEGIEARAIAQRFDLRAARVAGSAEEAAINARAEIRTAWLGYSGAHELARHAREAIVPLGERMSAEQLRRYNGMLIGVFDLIADAADRINTVNIALGTERGFWLAEVNLHQALTGVGATGAGARSGLASGFGVPTLQHVH
jgi:hypothetical protein